MQSHCSDCQGTRSAKNGRWVLVLLRKITEQGEGVFTVLEVCGQLTLADYLRMAWHRAYATELKPNMGYWEGSLHLWVTTQTERQSMQREENTCG